MLTLTKIATLVLMGLTLRLQLKNNKPKKATIILPWLALLSKDINHYLQGKTPHQG